MIGRDQYLGPDGDPRDRYASVLRADDLTGAPPALIMTAEYDVLCDEGEAYADRLRAAGVEVTSLCYPGMVHGFLMMDALTPTAVTAMAEIAGFLERMLTTAPG